MVYLFNDKDNTYIMRHLTDSNKYIATTYKPQATQFTYKQARTLIKNNRASLRWISKYQIVDAETNEEVNKNYAGNSNAGEDIPVKEHLVEDILTETDSILSLAGWSRDQLCTMKEQLNYNLSYYDMQLSDVEHIIEYNKPTADVMTKIMMIVRDLRQKHTKTKQCMRNLEVMVNAIDQNYTIEKLKLELAKVQNQEYKGRTKLYDEVLSMIEFGKTRPRRKKCVKEEIQEAV